MAENEQSFIIKQSKEKSVDELLLALEEVAYQKQKAEQNALELLGANNALTLQNKFTVDLARELSDAVNELKAVELQLKEANKELEAFSYSVSHDLRAPLRAIAGYSNILQEDYGSSLDEEANRVITVIVHNAQMMSELIDNLLTFSKMARLEAINNAVNMHTLVQTCVSEIRQIHPQQNTLITILPLPECSGDASMLKQLWYNILDNAIKYSSKKDSPQIEVGCMDDERYHVYYVKDNGTGFNSKYAGKLFGVFQRLHRQDEFEGTGLGLALAKRIVTKHGGDIWANSTLNEGTTFYFSIPKIR